MLDRLLTELGFAALLRLKTMALPGYPFEAARFVADANLVVVRFVSLEY